jgi:hypothetical protein
MTTDYEVSSHTEINDPEVTADQNETSPVLPRFGE